MIRSNRRYKEARRRQTRSRPSRAKPLELIDLLRERCDKYHLDTMRASENPRDRMQILFGYRDPFGQMPVHFHRDIYKGHLLGLGSTGAGKSAWMIAQALQLTGQNRRLLSDGKRASVIIVVDLKPDMTFLHALRHAATHHDGKTRPIPFNFITIGGSNQPTMPFNLFEQKFFKEKPDREKAAFLVPAINMDDGLGYGERHFTAHSYEAVARMIMVKKPRSFRDLASYGKLTRKQFAKELRIDPAQFDAMSSMVTELAGLARVPQFNVSKTNSYGVPKPVLDNHIDIGEALLPGNEQVIYLAANSSLERKNAPIAASMVMASVIDAANIYRARGASRVQVFADEVQLMAKGNNIAEWIAKCRGAKVSLILGTQTLAQWPPDVRDIIVSQTNVKTVFDASDKVLADETMRMSGTKLETQTTYQQSRSVSINDHGESYTISAGRSTSFRDVPGLKPNELADANWDRAKGVLAITSKIPGSRHCPENGQAVPIFRSFPFPQDVHDAMGDTDFPLDPGTFIPAHYPDLMADPIFSSPPPSGNRNGSRASSNGNGRKRQNKTQRREAEAEEFADLFEEMQRDFPG